MNCLIERGLYLVLPQLVLLLVILIPLSDFSLTFQSHSFYYQQPEIFWGTTRSKYKETCHRLSYSLSRLAVYHFLYHLLSLVTLLCLLQLFCSTGNSFLSFHMSINLLCHVTGLKLDFSLPCFLYFNIKQALPSVIPSGVSTFSIFKTFI